MPNTIWKYPVLSSRCELEMPTNARILCVQMQGNAPCIWVQVNSDDPVRKRTFNIYGTGHELPYNPGLYIGTFQQGPFVWHLYMEQ